MLNILKKLDTLIGNIITAIEITLFADGVMKEGDHSTFLMEMMGFGTTNHLSSERFDEIRSDLIDAYDRVFETMPTKSIIRIGRWDVSKITRRGQRNVLSATPSCGSEELRICITMVKIDRSINKVGLPDPPQSHKYNFFMLFHKLY